MTRTAMLQSALFLSLTFPAVSFVQSAIGYVLVFFLVLWGSGFFVAQRVISTALAVVFGLLSFSFVHFLQSGSFSEFFDLVRILPIIAAAVAVRKMSFQQAICILHAVAWVNFLVVLLVEFNIFRSFFESFNSRTFDESYGRHAGLFSNVATLGSFSLLICTFALWGWLCGEKLKVSALYFILGCALLIASGGKSQLLVLLFVLIVSSIYEKGSVRLLRFFLIVLFCYLLLLAQDSGLIYLRQLDKLTSLFSNGLTGVSSLSARFENWLSFFYIWKSDLIYALFGVPLLYLDEISGTFDSDWLWLFFRFGLLAFFAYLFLIVLGIMRSITSKRYPILPLIAVALGSSVVGFLLSFQLSFLVWFIVFASVNKIQFRSSPDKVA